MSTDKPTSETTIAEIQERQKARLQIADTMHEIFKTATRDIDFLLAELDEINGCNKCDLCEDHHG